MKVEIWSDIMCPFCYIGKRKFEKALEQFEHKGDVEIIWKSFQLNPDMETDPGRNINQYLAEIKGWSLEQAKEMNGRVTQMAEAVGLKYDFDKAIVANSFDAHRLIQLAKTKGKGDLAEERLFKAYFTEGSNIADKETLSAIGTSIGLEPEEVKEVLDSDKFAENVQEDLNESQQIGVRGVPFFVFDRKYAVSGAQESDAFLEVLRKASEA
ncbi:MAG: oxidoreductase [Bacteroidetes bacterium]|jgi:predicted DsbA family dithiol-disulfide isomerase|nr:oxidoreductase [Bacteroidota bacterium]